MPRRFVNVVTELLRQRPELDDPAAAVAEGRVLVDGRIISNPAAHVRRGASLVVTEPLELRGSAKLRTALDAFGVDVGGRVALDVGASTGGFTSLLLERGAERVYAVDAGHGQLLGSLRQDPRVVNLESTNVADVDRSLVPDPIDVATIDVSYLSLSQAVSQLDRVDIAPEADLIGLVKPMFELRLASAPTDRASLDEALSVAAGGIEASGWRVVRSIDSPHPGAGGALELFIHARWGRAARK